MCFDARGNGGGLIAPTMTGDHNSRITDYTGVICYPTKAHTLTAKHDGSPYPDKGNGANIACVAAGFKAGNGAKAGGIGYCKEVSPTLSAAQVPGVVYALQGSMVGREEKNGPQGDGINKDICFTLNTTDRNAVAYGVNCRNFYTYKELYSTLQAKENGGQSLNFSGAVLCKHIDWTVRRPTPLECERLQGYPDGWTELPKIKDMTNEEYALFLRVWQTDREIRGISYKTLPDKKKLVKWYNRLESDTSRYQALGNSLAIPCALRVIGGIVDCMTGTGK